MSRETTARAYTLAISAATAAMNAPSGQEARAARDALLEVDDVAELQRVAGVLAFVAVRTMPRATRRGRSVREALDRLRLEMLWHTS